MRSSARLGLPSIALALLVPLPAAAQDLGCGYLVQGVECLLFRTDGGGLYHLLDRSDGFVANDRVRASGTIDPSCASVCMQEQACLRSTVLTHCGTPARLLAPPLLVRSDRVTALAPLAPPRAALFAGPSCAPAWDPETRLDPLGPDCDAREPWRDDDDAHVAACPAASVDPDEGVLDDATRPLVLYQVDSWPPVGNRLKLTKEESLRTVVIGF